MECEFYDMPLFRGCDRTLVDPILEKSPSRIANYRKGEFIAMQNSVCRSLLLLCEGSVRVQMTNEEGREFTLDTLAAPDVLASAFLFATENTFPVSVIANTECRLWIVSRESLLALIESDTAVLRNFLSILSDHSRFLTSRVQQFALQTLSSRLIGYLEKTRPYRTFRRRPSSSASHAPPCHGQSPNWSARESCAKARRDTFSSEAAGQQLQPFCGSSWQRAPNRLSLQR